MGQKRLSKKPFLLAIAIIWCMNASMNWGSFEEAREAIDNSSLEELQEISGRQKPSMLPFGPLALILGLLVFLVSVFANISGQKNNAPSWPTIFGLLAALYGAISMTMNGNRGRNYRQSVYRSFVHQMAASMNEADDET